MKEFSIKFDDKGLVPVITQEKKTGTVLMMAYMNEEALKKTLESKKVHYWSRSRQKLWLKGESSGHYQIAKEIRYDCDGDCILIEVEQVGNACHTGNFSCFFNSVYKDEKNEDNVQTEDADESKILQEIYDIIMDRTRNPKEGSYTNYLFEKGLDKMLKKVGEEASEVIIAAKNRQPEEVKYEVADLLYHILVLLVEENITLEDIYKELRSRNERPRNSK